MRFFQEFLAAVVRAIALKWPTGVAPKSIAAAGETGHPTGHRNLSGHGHKRIEHRRRQSPRGSPGNYSDPPKSDSSDGFQLAGASNDLIQALSKWPARRGIVSEASEGAATATYSPPPALSSDSVILSDVWGRV